MGTRIPRRKVAKSGVPALRMDTPLGLALKIFSHCCSITNMFRAYSSGGNSGDGDDSERKRQSDRLENGKSREFIIAVQKTMSRQYQKEQVLKRKAEEKQEFQQCGYGESDDDDDDGGVRIAAPEDEQFDEEQVMVNPEIRKQKEMQRHRQEYLERHQPRSSYNTFPSRRRSPNRESEPRRRSRSRSRDHRRKKKKRSRRRSSSSSSSASRSYSRRRKSPPPPKKTTVAGRSKYEFLTEHEYSTRNSLSTRLLIRDVRRDHENYSLGQPKKEIANCRLETRFIDGLEHNHVVFNRLYGAECVKDRKANRPFHELLADIAKVIPTETRFRRVEIVDGFWRIRQRKDLLNALNDQSEGETKDEAIHDEHMFLRKRVQENVHDIDAMLALLEMEDELLRTRSGSFALGDRRTLLDRQVSIIDKAIAHNPANSFLRVLHADYLVQLDSDPHVVLDVYRKIVHSFPHDPLAWTRYLDYVQYNSSVYSYRRMWEAFRECLKKVGALVEGTLLSHVHRIDDVANFRTFYVFVYTRCLKWFISTGLVPMALANIQASFELNFGFGDDVYSKSGAERDEMLMKFWKTQMPRIGDRDAVGAEKTMKLAQGMSDEEKCRKEMGDYEIMLHKMLEAVQTSLCVVRPLKTSWIEFERKMLDIDARVKRTMLDDSPVLDEDRADEIWMYGVWRAISPYDENADLPFLPFFSANKIREEEMVQPMLEVLGVVFRFTTGYFSPTESLIETWRSNGTVPLDKTTHFDSVPTYSETTMTTFGLNALSYFIHRRHEIAMKEPSRLDELLVTYLTAIIMTKAAEFERNPDLLFYKLKSKHFNVLLEDCIEHTYANILATYPHLHSILRIVAVEKFVGWLELATLEQQRVSANERAALELGHHVIEKDKKALEDAQKKVFKTLEKCSPLGDASLTSADSSLAAVQINLYSVLLRARATMRHQKTVRMMLAMSVLKMDRQAVVQLEASAEYGLKVRTAMGEAVEAIGRKEEAFIGIHYLPEFARAGALVEALQIVVDFAFLDFIPHVRQAVNETVAKAMGQCEQFKQLRTSERRSARDKKQDARDIELLLDTLISVLADHCVYTEHYTRVVRTATDLFPCVGKYAKRYAELYATSTIKMMRLALNTDEINRRASRQHRRRFDVEHDRRQLMTSLTAMLGSLQSGRNAERRNHRTVYEAIRREALKLNEPAVWRLAIKAAARVDRKCLVDDAFVRARGRCPDSLNAHFDYVEGTTLYPPSEESDSDEKKMVAKEIEAIKDESKPHNLYVESCDILGTQREIAMKKSNEQKAECLED